MIEKYPKFDLFAINDLTDTKTLAHLLKYDSNYGTWDKNISATKSELKVGSKNIRIFDERDPAKLPWEKLGIDLVIESTGFFTDANDAKAHIKAGAKKVIITAPAKNQDATIVLGVNEDVYNSEKHNIVSMASCTTNGLAPIMRVLIDNFGVKRGFLTTVHSYTNDQRILDLPHEDLRRARAAALNIIPTSTGAAKAISEVIPELSGKMDGVAIRVPTPTVSVNDIVVELEKETTTEKITEAMLAAARGKMKNYLWVSMDPTVSTDWKGSSYSSIFDGLLTKNVGGSFYKLFSWYDNEWGYSCRVADLADYISRTL